MTPAQFQQYNLESSKAELQMSEFLKGANNFREKNQMKNFLKSFLLVSLSIFFFGMQVNAEVTTAEELAVEIDKVQHWQKQILVLFITNQK